MKLLETADFWVATNKETLLENSTDNAKKTLDVIIGTLEKSDSDSSKDMLKMAKGMLDYYDKEKSFSPDQAKWIYNTSKSLFK